MQWKGSKKAQLKLACLYKASTKQLERILRLSNLIVRSSVGEDGENDVVLRVGRRAKAFGR